MLTICDIDKVEGTDIFHAQVPRPSEESVHPADIHVSAPMVDSCTSKFGSVVGVCEEPLTHNTEANLRTT